MTLDKFLITNVLKTVKLYNGAKSLAVANSESQLIHDGLKILGYNNKEFVEEIDDLKAYYWEVQDTEKAISGLVEEEQRLAEELNQALNNRESKESNLDEKTLSIQDERRELLAKQQSLSRKLDAVEAEGRSNLKIHQGLKAAKKHLSEQDSKKMDQKINSCIRELKDLKAERDTIVKEQSSLTELINQQETLLKEAKSTTKSLDLGNQSKVGESNKRLSNNRVEQTKLKLQVEDLYFQIGEYLLKNQKHREVRQCTKSHRRIITQVKALRKSINYHRQLGHR